MAPRLSGRVGQQHRGRSTRRGNGCPPGRRITAPRLSGREGKQHREAVRPGWGTARMPFLGEEKQPRGSPSGGKSSRAHFPLPRSPLPHCCHSPPDPTRKAPNDRSRRKSPIFLDQGRFPVSLARLARLDRLWRTFWKSLDGACWCTTARWAPVCRSTT
jgi:hypothetical protein